MKCNRAVDEYLERENFSHLPLLLRFHILFCTECRREIARLRKLFISLNNDSLYQSPYDISSSVMNIIRRDQIYSARTISVFKWVTIGSIIFLSIFLINFSESFLWLKNEFGSDYTIPMNIVMGFFLSGYAIILIGCNYEYIKKYIDLHVKWKIK